MARIHSHRRGTSHSIRPTLKRIPSWLSYSPDEITTLIVKMAKDELTPSQIGTRLRDEYNIPLVKPILGKDIVEAMAENGVKLKLPEELARLLSRANKLQVHLKSHKGDHKNVRSLELLEAKIHRLSKYYKRMGVLPSTWKYNAMVAKVE
jgi:small subunit ribosomal protein S15